MQDTIIDAAIDSNVNPNLTRGILILAGVGMVTVWYGCYKGGRAVGKLLVNKFVK